MLYQSGLLICHFYWCIFVLNKVSYFSVFIFSIQKSSLFVASLIRSLPLSLRIIRADVGFCVIFMCSELVEKWLYKINL